MNFFLDENFPKPVTQILESRGHIEKLLFALDELDLTNIKSTIILIRDNDYSILHR